MQLLLLFLLLSTPTETPFEIVSSDTVLTEGVNVGYNTSSDGTRFGIVEKYKGVLYNHDAANPAVGYWGTIKNGQVSINEFKVYPGQGPSDIPHRSSMWFIQPVDDYFVVGITNGEIGIIQLRYYDEDFNLINTEYPKFEGDGKTTPAMLDALLKKARGMWDMDANKLKPGITQEDYDAAWDDAQNARSAGGFISGSEFRISRDGKRIVGRLSTFERVQHKVQKADRFFGYYQWVIIDVEQSIGRKLLPVVDQSAPQYTPDDIYTLSRTEQLDWFEISNRNTIAAGLRRNANWFKLSILEDGTLVQIWPAQSKLKIMDSNTYEVTKIIDLKYPPARVIDSFWKYYGRNSDINSKNIQELLSRRPKYATSFKARHEYWNLTEPKNRTNGLQRSLWPGLTSDCPANIRTVLEKSKPYFDADLQFDASVFGVISTGKSYWVIGISDIPKPETPTESILTIYEYSLAWEKVRSFNVKNNSPNMLSMSMQLMVYAVSPTEMVGLRDDSEEGLMVSLFNIKQ